MLKVTYDGRSAPRVTDEVTGIDVPNVVSVTMNADATGVKVHLLVHPISVEVLAEQATFYLPDPLTGQPRELAGVLWADGTRWDPAQNFGLDTETKGRG